MPALLLCLVRHVLTKWRIGYDGPFRYLTRDSLDKEDKQPVLLYSARKWNWAEPRLYLR
jgi:hypothetical protein